VTRAGSPSAVVSRNAATTSTLDVDHACDPDTRPSTVTSSGSSSGAKAKERPSTPARESRSGTSAGQLGVLGRGVGLGVRLGPEVRVAVGVERAGVVDALGDGRGVTAPRVDGAVDPPGAPPDGICPQPAIMITRPIRTPKVGPRMDRPYVGEPDGERLLGESGRRSIVPS
jgi:hypothetical protein